MFNQNLTWTMAELNSGVVFKSLVDIDIAGLDSTSRLYYAPHSVTINNQSGDSVGCHIFTDLEYTRWLASSGTLSDPFYIANDVLDKELNLTKGEVTMVGMIGTGSNTSGIVVSVMKHN